MHTSFEVRTPARDAMIDITSSVATAIDEAGVTDGLVHVYVPHTTGES